MRKYAAAALSLAIIYGFTLWPTTEVSPQKNRTVTYKGINNEAFEALKAEISAKTIENNTLKTRVSKHIENLKEKKSIVYQTHSKSQKQPVASYIWIYLAGLCVGIAGFATFRNKQASVGADSFEADSLNPTMKRVLTELSTPVLICNSDFVVTWQNKESEKLNLGTDIIQDFVEYSFDKDFFEVNSKNYDVKVDELKHKTGQVNYMIQLVTRPANSNLLSHVSNASDVEKILDISNQGSENFKGMNQLVAENTLKMNSLFKNSSKFMDVDFDENLSECFIESGRLNDAVSEFMMANYQLIKNDSQVSSVYFRTSEKGQRFNLNCFIPSLQKDSFAVAEASNIFIQKLSTLESKFNLYYPRVSFRWITMDEIQGVDICLSLENKSELESTLKETNT